jgi:hypothetical protein
MSELDLADLVVNRTLSPAMAATLATAAQERRSLLVAAIPRMAGKSTTMMATLQHAPPGTELHMLDGAHGPSLGIPAKPGGYLVLAEIAKGGFMSHYLWGEPVRQIFQAVRNGFSLATALHASGLDEAFEIVTRGNSVPDADAAQVDLMVYVRSLGADWQNPSRRVIAEIHEIEAVERGEPRSRLLHRWDEARDRFIAEERPARIGRAGGDYARHLSAFELVQAGA